MYALKKYKSYEIKEVGKFPVIFKDFGGFCFIFTKGFLVLFQQKKQDFSYFQKWLVRGVCVITKVACVITKALSRKYT